MDYLRFRDLVTAAAPPGTVLENPGRGTSTVVKYEDDRLCYIRGEARFYVHLADLYAAYRRFLGQDVETTGVKRFAPEIFDTKRGGHDCHTTVLFRLLEAAGLSSEIWGRGQRGAPFGVSIGAPPNE